MKKILFAVAFSLITLNAFASSLACESAIDNVVNATAKYFTVSTTSNSSELVGASQDAMLKAIEVANNVCK
jgi:hypothetical protein